MEESAVAERKRAELMAVVEREAGSMNTTCDETCVFELKGLRVSPSSSHFIASISLQFYRHTPSPLDSIHVQGASKCESSFSLP